MSLKKCCKATFLTFAPILRQRQTHLAEKKRTPLFGGVHSPTVAADELGGQHTELVLKALGKITRRREAHTLGQLADRHGGMLAQGLGGFLQTNVANELLRGLACRRIEFAVKARAAQAHVGAELVHAIFGVGQVLFDTLDGTTQEVVVDGGCIFVGLGLDLHFVEHKILVQPLERKEETDATVEQPDAIEQGNGKQYEEHRCPPRFIPHRLTVDGVTRLGIHPAAVAVGGTQQQAVTAFGQVVQVNRIHTLRQVNPLVAEVFDAVGKSHILRVQVVEGRAIQNQAVHVASHLDVGRVAHHQQ